MRRRVLHAVVVATVVATGLLGFGAAAGASAPRASVPKPPEPTADSPGTQDLRPIVEAAVTDLAVRLGVAPLGKAPFLQLLDTKLAGGGKYAHTWTYGDDADTCLIQVQPNGQHLAYTDTKLVLYHEVVHCYQARATGGADVTDWVEEGSAMWAAAELVPGSSITTEKWGPYLGAPNKSLFGRAYDGIGFFGHLEDVGIDVWPRLLPMTEAEDDAAAFAIGVEGSPAALDDWPSGLAREPSFGAAWDTSGPDIPATKPPRLGRAVANGKSASASVPKAANALLDLDVSADVVTIATSADVHGRLRDAGGIDHLLVDVSGRTFCALPQGCACPDGSAGDGVDLDAIAPGAALLGASGGAKAAHVTVQGRSLDDFCKHPTKVDPCLVGTWVSTEVVVDVPGTGITGSGGAGSVLMLRKNGTGSVDLDASTPVITTLPGGLTGRFKLSGHTGGLVSASNGLVRTLALGEVTAQIQIDVPGLGGQIVPLSGGGSPFDGTYTCTKTTLTYTAPGLGGHGTWARS